MKKMTHLRDKHYFPLFSALLSVLLSTTTFSQTDGCATPTVLPVNATCSTTGFSVNFDGTGQVVNASCATGTALEDGWYRITASSSSTTVNISDGNRDLCLAAFTGCGTGQLACAMIPNGDNGSITIPTTSGTSYYIQIQRRSGNNTANLSGDICAIPTPAGSSCVMATTLTPGVQQCGTNSTAGIFPDNGSAPTNTCNPSYNDGEYWFKYTATTTQGLTLNMSGLSGNYSGLFVYDGCPSSGGTCVANKFVTFSTANYSLTTYQFIPGHTYYIGVVNQANPYSTNFCLSSTLVTSTPTPANITCSVPSPICSGSPITFVANSGGPSASTVNPGNTYGCLTTSPNPSWYYMEIAHSGNLAINITAGSDVDFRMWGPFSNLATAQAGCNSFGAAIDCSYSTSATEQANATVTAGQVWVLLVTNYANTIQNISINEAGTNTASTNCAIVPLPVGYSNWDIAYFNNQVQLIWSTESEQNNDKFFVQRSTNGVNWETIGAVKGKGNSDSENDYSYLDKNPANGISYYRLQQFDLDGKFSYTSILSVKTGNEQIGFKIYPNPATSSFTVKTDGSKADELILTDVVGKTYTPVYTASGDYLTVDCQAFDPGCYTLTVISNGQSNSQRLFISK